MLARTWHHAVHTVEETAAAMAANDRVARYGSVRAVLEVLAAQAQQLREQIVADALHGFGVVKALHDLAADHRNRGVKEAAGAALAAVLTQVCLAQKQANIH